MHVILGASGNTGHVVAKTLLGRGQKVRAVGRNATHLQPLAANGAEIFIADLTDASALTKAFQDADSAYVMVPPNPSSTDYRTLQDRTSDAIAVALRKAGVKHIVSLSSFGADKSSGTGPVVGLHNLEQKLNQIDAANVLHLRAGYFMENTLPQARVIRMMGSAVGPVRPDLKLPMIATRDIGAAAADALYVQASDDQLRTAFVQMGMSDNVAGLILEMAAALNSGHMRTLEPRTPRNTTPTPYETFVAQSFVPAYQQQQAA